MNYKTLLPLFVFIVLLTPVVTLAQFQPLVGIPGISDPNTDFNTYINTLYAISISVAGLVAVIKIIVAGVKWMLSDLVTSKEDAKKDIEGAIIGLLIIISAVLILEVINPQLTKTSLFLAPADAVPGSGNGSVPKTTTGDVSVAPLPVTEVPIYQETTKCVKDTAAFSWSGWDCSAAEAACTAKGGKKGMSFASEFKCVLGENKSVYCKAVDSPNSMEKIADCNPTKLACETPGTNNEPKAGIFTKLDGDDWKANCYRPY